ncbi:unnamed protein product [Cylicocyclus nassatus]|uniref:Uncharacterized protein n=1 Tax=Cylicocyclus nassatus TaxID=53992 RepID=A0AA36GLV7_CYLNA|nr:unnamed protein product [Cylicocyclus nassatus]
MSIETLYSDVYKREATYYCLDSVPLQTTSQELQAKQDAIIPPTEVVYGEKEVSKPGKHHVIFYDIPGSSKRYVFGYQKETGKGDSIYTCNGCRRQGKKYTPIYVMNTTFHVDPCHLPHNCTPFEKYKDKAERATYKICRSFRSKRSTGKKPRQNETKRKTRRHHNKSKKKTAAVQPEDILKSLDMYNLFEF